MAREVLSHLAHLGPYGGRKKEKKMRQEKKKRELWREKLYLLSKFSDARTGGFRRSKRESLSSQLELLIETRVGSFDKLREIWVFSYLV